jgi:hypothetical protein
MMPNNNDVTAPGGYAYLYENRNNEYVMYAAEGGYGGQYIIKNVTSDTTYHYTWYNPSTGSNYSTGTVNSTGSLSVTAPDFNRGGADNDVVLWLKKTGSAPPPTTTPVGGNDK